MEALGAAVAMSSNDPLQDHSSTYPQSLGLRNDFMLGRITTYQLLMWAVCRMLEGQSGSRSSTILLFWAF